MIDIEHLVTLLEKYNQAYRNGQPLISDAEYDRLTEQLRAHDPQHPFLHRVEPEKFDGRKEIRHPVPMLSTEKAYTDEQLRRFVNRVEKEGKTTGVGDLCFKLTPKLDGLAGRDDGAVFVSRGNGLVGFEISSAFDKGIVPIGGRGQGLGEIVVVQSYFDTHLAGKFEHPRNMVVGIVSSENLNQDAAKALADGMVHFVPYNQLPVWKGRAGELLKDITAFSDDLMARTDYPLDGVVLEVINEDLKNHMGATAHHYRWQIAVKRKGDTAETRVRSIQWQVGRTGNVTPVMAVVPVTLSGATIRRVTAHHAGMLIKHKIGPGARIEVIRSGEVIPKLERVLAPSQDVNVPELCPACGTGLVWKGDFLRCTWQSCPAQIEKGISHWFRTLGSADWFGIKTIEKLVANGYDTIEKIYAMVHDDFAGLGFGPVQSMNLAEALMASRTKEVEDWRFLAAFGIPDLGVGDSRKLLQHVPLEELIGIDARTIVQIDGFGETTSQSISQGVNGLKKTIRHMLDLGFNLRKTALLAESDSIKSPIAGKKIVFSGKMKAGTRESMQAHARQLGAMVQSSVSSATDLLICGEKVGPAKLEKASRLGVEIISEDAYKRLIQV